VCDAPPGQLGDVDQALDAAQVNEYAEVGDSGHSAGDSSAGGQFLEQLQTLAWRSLGGALREHHAFTLWIALDHFQLQRTSDIRSQGFLAFLFGDLFRKLDQVGNGYESFDSFVFDQQSPAVVPCDFELDDLILFEKRFSPFPIGGLIWKLLAGILYLHTRI